MDDSESPESRSCGSPSLLSSLRGFRYANAQKQNVPKFVLPQTVSATTTSSQTENSTSSQDKPNTSSIPTKPAAVSTETQTSTGLLKLNTQIFKRLHECTNQAGSPPSKKACVTTESMEKSMKHFQKLFPGVDVMEIQDALIHANWDTQNAMLKLNEVIKNKINPKPKVRPEASMSTVTSTNRVWKRIKTHVSPTRNAASCETASSNSSSKPICSEVDNGINCVEDKYSYKSKRRCVLDFLSTGPLAELIIVHGLTVKKANSIINARPFEDWKTLSEKLEQIGIQVDTLFESVAELLRVRNQVSALMKTCSELSSKLALKLQQLSVQTSLAEQPSSLGPGLKLAGYQMIGLSWLRLMHNQGVNGILADEMGLGKTIQVIAFLAYLKEQNMRQRVHMIVVPSSTLENWLNELHRWCPSLKVESYYGSQEERRAFRSWWRDERNKSDVQNVDILVTTYNLINSTADDKSFFRKMEIQYIIYDEAHMLKNMMTQRYLSLMKIKAEHRILLTGTPLQNNLVELFSLLIFVMPDIFADKQNDLKTLFKNTKNSNDQEQCSFEKEKISQAKKIMEPFVLRRLKKDVLRDLPPKSDETLYCDMTSLQAASYAELLAEFQNSNDDEIGADINVESQDDIMDEGLTGSMAMMMLLRRVANHTALIRHYYTDRVIKSMAKKLKKDRSYKDNKIESIVDSLYSMSDYQLHKLCFQYDSIASYKQTDANFLLNSGKFAKLDDLLPQLHSQEHRVLLFSQFRQALDIIEDYLQLRNYKYVRLDGQTPVSERQDLIDSFNSDPSIFIFLLTTKAGGCGINLASADTVILHDIDLNPYNDKQAEDRCHRVGQQKPVTVMRLISRGTIEEAMLKIAHNKLTLEKQITHGDTSKQRDQKLLSLLKEALKVK